MRGSGILLLVLCALVVVFSVLEAPAHVAVPLVLGAVFLAVLGWASMLRPRVWLTSRDLVLRTMVPRDGLFVKASARGLPVGVLEDGEGALAVFDSLRAEVQSKFERPGSIGGAGHYHGSA